MSYRLTDHTSDLGMVISGPDLPGLLRNACFAVFDNILNLEAVEARERQLIELKSETREELFMDWLRELLFRFATQFFVVRQVGRLDIDGLTLRAEVQGERFDPTRHQVKLEIKTPTYHMFRLEPTPTGWQATVLFDV